MHNGERRLPKNRMIPLAFGVAAALVVTACGGSSTTTTSSTSAAAEGGASSAASGGASGSAGAGGGSGLAEVPTGDTVQVTLITKDSINPFFIAMQEGAKAAAADVELVVVVEPLLHAVTTRAAATPNASGINRFVGSRLSP